MFRVQQWSSGFVVAAAQAHTCARQPRFLAPLLLRHMECPSESGTATCMPPTPCCAEPASGGAAHVAHIHPPQGRGRVRGRSGLHALVSQRLLGLTLFVGFTLACLLDQPPRRVMMASLLLPNQPKCQLSLKTGFPVIMDCRCLSMHVTMHRWMRWLALLLQLKCRLLHVRRMLIPSPMASAWTDVPMLPAAVYFLGKF